MIFICSTSISHYCRAGSEATNLVAVSLAYVYMSVILQECNYLNTFECTTTELPVHAVERLGARQWRLGRLRAQ